MLAEKGVKNKKTLNPSGKLQNRLDITTKAPYRPSTKMIRAFGPLVTEAFNKGAVSLKEADFKKLSRAFFKCVYKFLGGLYGL